MEDEIIFMHMTQGDLAFMNRDYLVLCHCGVIAGKMCFHFSAQRAGKDKTTTGMLCVCVCFAGTDAGCALHSLPKLLTEKHPQMHLRPLQ